MGRHQDTGLPGWTAASRSQQTRLCRFLSAGYRSFLLAALDERIKAAVDIGWMTSFRSQIRAQVTSTVSLSFHINGLYRYLDLPDLASLIAPRAVLVINGSQDRVFALDGDDSKKRSTISPARARSPCLFVCLLPP